MKLSLLGMDKIKVITVLRAGGIVAASLFIAFFINPALAQFGTAEEIACTSSGGTYYLNVDCGLMGGSIGAGGYAYSCWICEPANTSWCTSAGGTPVWTPIDAQMAGGYWDCIMPQTCSGSSACAVNTCSGSTCTDTCGTAYAGTKNCTPPPTTCADLGQVGTYPACTTPPPAYAESTYAPPYAESTYAPGYSQTGYYSQSTYAPVGCGTPSATLKAAPTRVRSGQTSTLTLTATGVTTSCSITGPGVNTTVAASSCGVSKTLVTPAITSQVTYKVTCDSTVDIAKIIVNLVPNVTEF